MGSTWSHATPEEFQQLASQLVSYGRDDPEAFFNFQRALVYHSLLDHLKSDEHGEHYILTTNQTKYSVEKREVSNGVHSYYVVSGK